MSEKEGADAEAKLTRGASEAGEGRPDAPLADFRGSAWLADLLADRRRVPVAPSRLVWALRCGSSGPNANLPCISWAHQPSATSARPQCL